MTNKKLVLASAGAAAGLIAAYAVRSRNKNHIAFDVVKNFDIKKYLGLWYEIARIDHRFEKNKTNATAQYSINQKGNIHVMNRGYDKVKQEWSERSGKAKHMKQLKGKLKVSFYGPFYSPYNVIDLDEYYKYALVAGKNFDYLWILSREKSIPDRINERFLAKAKEIGFDTSRLIWPSHNRVNG